MSLKEKFNQTSALIRTIAESQKEDPDRVIFATMKPHLGRGLLNSKTEGIARSLRHSHIALDVFNRAHRAMQNGKEMSISERQVEMIEGFIEALQPWIRNNIREEAKNAPEITPAEYKLDNMDITALMIAYNSGDGFIFLSPSESPFIARGVEIGMLELVKNEDFVRITEKGNHWIEQHIIPNLETGI